MFEKVLYGICSRIAALLSFLCSLLDICQQTLAREDYAECQRADSLLFSDNIAFLSNFWKRAGVRMSTMLCGEVTLQATDSCQNSVHSNCLRRLRTGFWSYFFLRFTMQDVAALTR